MTAQPASATVELGPRCIVALDYPDSRPALDLAGRIDPARCRVKVGKELFVRAGPAVVTELQSMGHQVFLDLKFHDIPNTVAGACAAAADLGVWMMNVHASGGVRMLEAAKEAVGGSDSRLIAVTVLTSLERSDLARIGLDRVPAELVLEWAQMTAQAGLDGVVCSPADLGKLRESLAPAFLTVTPGVRPQGVGAGDDQRRVMTPVDAIEAGASYLVIGRPITAAQDPAKALETIAADVERAAA